MEKKKQPIIAQVLTFAEVETLEEIESIINQQLYKMDKVLVVDVSIQQTKEGKYFGYMVYKELKE